MLNAESLTGNRHPSTVIAHKKTAVSLGLAAVSIRVKLRITS